MPDPTPTLTDIAASLRRHSPGALPVLGDEDGRLCMIESSGRGEYAANWHVPLPDDIARHVLIAAMVMDCGAQRDWLQDKSTRWWYVTRKDGVEEKSFEDKDHNNDPLLSLYGAWLWEKGLSNA